MTPTIWDVPTKYNRTNQAKNSDDLEMVAFIIKYSTLASVGGLIDKDYDWVNVFKGLLIYYFDF